MKMKASQKIVVNQIGRIIAGATCGLFLSKVYDITFKDSNIPMKVVGFIGAMATSWGVGHVFDLWFDQFMPTDDETLMETLKDDLGEISKEE